MRHPLWICALAITLGCSVSDTGKKTSGHTVSSSTGSPPVLTCGPVDEADFAPTTPGSFSLAPGAQCQRDIDCVSGSYCVVVNGTCANPKTLQGPGLGGFRPDGTACVASPAFPVDCDAAALSWSASVDVSHSASSTAESDATIVSDGHGKVLIGWANNTSGARQQFDGLALSTDDGASFTSVAPPSHAMTDAENDAALAIDGDGLMYYVWESYANNFKGAQHVYTSQSSDGTNWSAPLQVDTDGDDQNGSTALDFPSVAINPVNGRPYYTYQITTNSAPPLRLVVGAKGGGSVMPAVTLNDGKRTSVYRDLANGTFDQSGSYYAAWSELTGGSTGMGLESGAASSSVYFTRVDPSGEDGLSPLGHDVRVSAPGETVLFGVPQIVSAPDGSAQYVIYETGTKNAIDVRVAASHDKGASWGPSVIVNDDATCATHHRASAALDANGRLWVLFYDNREGTGHMVYSMSDDGAQTFHVNRLVTREAFPFETFQYSVGWLGDYFGVTASGGKLYAAFSDPHQNGQSHIQFVSAPLP